MGNTTTLGITSVDECWTSCVDTYGSLVVAVDWSHNDTEYGDCYCQEKCDSLADCGDYDGGYDGWIDVALLDTLDLPNCSSSDDDSGTVTCGSGTDIHYESACTHCDAHTS